MVKNNDPFLLVKIKQNTFPVFSIAFADVTHDDSFVVMSYYSARI